VRAVPLLPQLWVMALSSDKVIAVLKDATSSGSTYVFSLLALLLSLDALLGLHDPFARTFLFISLSVLLSSLHMLWIHCLVTTSTDLTILGRIREARPFYAPLIVPSFLYAAAQALTVAYPIYMAQLLTDLHWDWSSTYRVLAVPSTAAILHICLLIPNGIVLSRVEAALLAPEERTFVLFEADRIIKQDDGSAKMSFVVPWFRAWRTLDFQLWRRSLKHSFLWMTGITFAWYTHTT